MANGKARSRGSLPFLNELIPVVKSIPFKLRGRQVLFVSLNTTTKRGQTKTEKRSHRPFAEALTFIWVWPPYGRGTFSCFERGAFSGYMALQNEIRAAAPVPSISHRMLWDQGVCPTTLWEALFVVSHKLVFPTALGLKDVAGRNCDVSACRAEFGVER